jgi:Structure-specific recognition protein (SSRP1)
MQSMDGKHVFELPLTEIGDVQGTKEDAILEFHVDDGIISQREDALCSITFVIPDDNERFPGIGSFPQHW